MIIAKSIVSLTLPVEIEPKNCEPKTAAGSETRRRSRSVALVVDDEPTNRLILTSMLKKAHFDIIEAENGRLAVEKFRENRVDIVFMDIMMPEMDGYQAAGEIKSLCVNRFVPLIFLTAVNNEDRLAKCVEVGGDDFLTKPYSKIILMSKIAAMERMRGLHEQLYDLYAQVKQDESTAEQIFSCAVLVGNLDHPAIRCHLQSADVFSGDMILSALTPDGDLNLLLGDFTGHGLSAAIGAMPASSIFRAMSAKGFSLADILEEINDKLYTLLPRNIFMAVQFIRVFEQGRKLEVYNGGMPDMYVVNGESGKVRKLVRAKGLPLGITAEFDEKEDISVVDLEPEDHIFLVSDGLLDARNSDKEYYGQENFIASIQVTEERPYLSDGVMQSVKEHIKGALQDDDISLVEVCCPLLRA